MSTTVNYCHVTYAIFNDILNLFCGVLKETYIVEGLCRFHGAHQVWWDIPSDIVHYTFVPVSVRRHSVFTTFNVRAVSEFEAMQSFHFKNDQLPNQ